MIAGKLMNIIVAGCFLAVVIDANSACNNGKERIPHDKDCDKYYACQWGQSPIEMSCPAGLVFDPNREECVWPAEYHCDSSLLTTTTSRPSTNGTDEYPHTPCRPIAEPNCPPTNPEGEYATHQAHPTDCRLWYNCVWGQPVLMHCPPGTHFNGASGGTLGYCVRQELAGCACRPS